MKKISFLILLLFIFPHLFAKIVDKDNLKNKQIITQLKKDETLIPLEKGAIFVPWIVSKKNEPKFTIFQKKHFIKDAEVGKRIVLEPGKYTLFIGSGPIDLRTKISVTVNKERVSVVIPSWSAIIVRILDEYNNFLRKGYQIYLEKSKLNIGRGISVDEIRGEKPKIWILKPGLYRIAKRGESPDSSKNFVTVRTVAGHLSNVDLIFDTNTNQLSGGGEIFKYENETENDEENTWTYHAIFAGNFAFNNSGYLNNSVDDTNTYSMGTTINILLKYDSPDYLFINKIESFEQFQKSKDTFVIFTRDIFQLDSSFIYRLNEYFGPYISVTTRSSFFNQLYKVSSDENTKTFAVDENGNKTLLKPDSDFTFKKSFSPTTLKESIGINFRYLYGTIFKIDARAGWGFKQDFAPHYYDISQSETTLNDFTEKDLKQQPYFQQSYGPDFSVSTSLTPFSFLEISEDFTALFPINNDENVFFSSRTTTSLWISNFAAIQYEFLIEKNALSLFTQKNHLLTVQLFYKLF